MWQKVVDQEELSTLSNTYLLLFLFFRVIGVTRQFLVEFSFDQIKRLVLLFHIVR